jgi:UDP-N-acetylmuramoyl-tripeptide--D-alanyl-D-alanine ligase
VAVLGDMLELGDAAREFHRAVGEHAAHMGIELLVTVGPLAAEMGAGFGGQVRAVPDARAAAQALPALLREGDTVLVKGSRGVGLELVAQALSGAAAAPGMLAGPRSR